MKSFRDMLAEAAPSSVHPREIKAIAKAKGTVDIDYAIQSAIMRSHKAGVSLTDVMNQLVKSFPQHKNNISTRVKEYAKANKILDKVKFK